MHHFRVKRCSGVNQWSTFSDTFLLRHVKYKCGPRASKISTSPSTQDESLLRVFGSPGVQYREKHVLLDDDAKALMA